MIKLLPKLKKNFEVEVVLIQGDPTRVKEQGILAVPTVQLFNNGEVIKTLVGYNDNIILKLKGVLSGKTKEV